MIDRVRAAASRVPTWAWALAFSLALCLPRLGSSGFWDPSELKLAEQARDISNSANLFDPTVGGRYPGRPPLDLSLAALGIKLFGSSELGARLFFALSALVALMAVYWAGAGLLRRRAGLLGTLVLGTTPIFVLEARQLTSDAPLLAGLALAMGGLGRYAWPPNGRRRLIDLAVGLIGLALGALAGGALSGVVLPLLALVAALVVGYGLVPVDASVVDDGTGPLAEAGIGPDVAAAQPLGASTWQVGARGFWVFTVFAVAALVLLALGMTRVVAGKYSALLGGVPRAGAPAHTFDALIRQLGFGLFPWSAVAVFALARPLIRLDGDTTPGARTNPRLAFVELYLLFFAGLGFAFSSYRDIVLGEARYVALPAIALAVGAFLDEALEGRRLEPVAGLLMAMGTMIVARDFYLSPEDLASVHLFDKVRWPPNVVVGNLILGVGFVAALGVYAGLAGRGRGVGPVDVEAAAQPARAGRVRRGAARLFGVLGRYGLQGSIACALFFAFYLTQMIVPALSTHLSFKPVLESYAKFARDGEKIGRYRVEGHGSSFYGKQTLVDLPSQDRVVSFLRDPHRVFALVAADELAALDAAFKQAGVPYYAVDASSSRFLLLSNQLAPGQHDDNPLLKNVWMPPVAGNPSLPSLPNAPAGNDKPPWTWRVPVTATFGDSIQLVGADFPETVHRPGRIPLDLYFKAKTRPPGGYKIFVHFDGPAAPRVIGDHDPVNRAFPTSFWLPGEYVRDHSETDVPLMTTPAGTYTVYFGFWPGGEGKRLKITDGPNDGADRVRLGTLEIK